MNDVVLLTGASSFTGLWIAQALAEAGFQVLAPLRRNRDAYAGVRRDRVRRLESIAEVVFGCPFGSQPMAELVRTRPRLDALAHHAADVAGYRDADFDAAAAFSRNVAGAPRLLELLRARGARVALVTGTVFEAGEGGSPPDAPAVTPYGLSKTLTSSAFRHYCDWSGMRFGRFVVPSPYGPHEEQRFSWHLFESWFTGKTPIVRTPRYVRDHIRAPSLAADYAQHLKALLSDPLASPVRRPSEWIASQGDFARRVAAEAAVRLGRECPLEFNEHREFAEPYLRVNNEPCVASESDQASFWDQYVAWYQALQRRGDLD